MAPRQRKAGDTKSPVAGAQAALPDVHSVSIDTTKGSGHLGVTLSNSDSGTGVFISHVDPNDLVAAAGLKQGDLLLTVGGKSVDTHEEAFDAIGCAGTVVCFEYWTAAEAKQAVEIGLPAKKSSGGSGWLMRVMVAFVLLAVAGVGGGAVYLHQSGTSLTSLVEGVVDRFNPPPLPKKSESAKPAKLSKKQERMSASAKIMASWSDGTIDEYEERLEALSKQELLEAMRASAMASGVSEKDLRSDADYAEITAEELRIDLIKQATTARRMAAEKAEDPKARTRRQLKLKDADDLKMILTDLQIAYPDDASTKALRQIAFAEGALAKWDLLPDAVKLEKNRARAAINLAAAEAAERARKKKRKEEEEEKNGQIDVTMERMAKAKAKKDWEIEWDSGDEQEAQERLSRLASFNAMNSDMKSSMMDLVRRDKGMLDMLESEKNMKHTMEDLNNIEGGKVHMNDLKAMGMSVKMFDKTKNLDGYLDVSGLMGGGGK